MTIHVQPTVRLEACPALVLNADYRPLSYYPLSIWCWQDAIKAVFLERVNIVSEYDRTVRSPSFEMRLPSVVSLKTYVKPSRHPAFTRFNVFLRDRFTCQYCGDARGLDLRPSGSSLEGRAYDLGKRRHRLLAVQSAQGRSPAARGRDEAAPDAFRADPARPPPQWPPVPAELPARELARLPLLGHRAGAVRPSARSPRAPARRGQARSRRSIRRAKARGSATPPRCNSRRGSAPAAPEIPHVAGLGRGRAAAVAGPRPEAPFHAGVIGA